MDKNLLEHICESYKNGMSWEKIYKTYGGVSIYIPKVSLGRGKENLWRSEKETRNVFFLLPKI